MNSFNVSVESENCGIWKQIFIRKLTIQQCNQGLHM